MNLCNGYEKVNNEGTIANSWDQISDFTYLQLSVLASQPTLKLRKAFCQFITAKILYHCFQKYKQISISGT